MFWMFSHRFPCAGITLIRFKGLSAVSADSQPVVGTPNGADFIFIF
jgi:hypothetical protein